MGILRAIDFVTRQVKITGRKSIISMSLGGPGLSLLMDIVIENAFDAGIFVVGELFMLLFFFCCSSFHLFVLLSIKWIMS